MHRSCPEKLAALLLVFLLSACSSRMDTNPGRLSQVRMGKGTTVDGGKQPNCDSAETNKAATSYNLGSGNEGDMATMEAVSNGCLTAWRKACAGDEKNAIAMLNDLDKHYPGVLTIQMMLGQTYEHFGHTKEAIEHYQKAVTGNEFNSMHVFKLAEAMRKNGDYKGAAENYRKVLVVAPHFGSANLGLARCLIAQDKKSIEARNLLGEAATDPMCEKEARALLDQLEPGAAAGN